jgi:hypothetical protein
MAIDAYSICPGGTGKKIKFCCGDFLPELQKIDRMMQGEQYNACLQTIDQTMAQEPGRNRECLMAIKGLLLRVTGQLEAAKAHAIDFLEKHPTNEVALAESAILTSQVAARPALGMLLGAIRAANGSISGRTYEAMGHVAAALLDEGLWLPGRALLQLQVAISDQHDEPVEMLLSLNRSPDVPLLLRDDPPLLPCPDDVPWHDRYVESVKTVGLGDWGTASDKLTALTNDVPDSPVIWRTLATLLTWQADNEHGIEALHKYAAICGRDNKTLEDAVEAEASAMLLSDDSLGDQLDMFRILWTVKDVERLHEAMLSSSRLRSLPFDPSQFTDGETPPPKMACMILDLPMPESCESLTTQNTPRLLGQALLYGRQTDREARLEVLGVAGDELQSTKEFIAGLAGDTVEPQTIDEVAGHWSASQKLLRAAWQPPQGATQQQIADLMSQHIKQALLQQWPGLKLGALDGRSPREVAGDAAYRIKILAAIMVLEHWSDRMLGDFDFNELRSQLGLPVLGPIDPSQHPVASLPLVRLARLTTESLSDDDLVLAYQRAMAFGIRPATRKFALVMIERSSLKGRTEQLQAYSALARTTEDPNQSIEYVNQGRLVAESMGQSSASWDLLELSLRFGRREGHEAVRLVEHIQHQHMNEPGVGEALTQMLIEVGLLRPDGTPAFGPGGPQPGLAAQPQADSNKLWTPDGESSGGGGGKLWTPE